MARLFRTTESAPTEGDGTWMDGLTYDELDVLVVESIDAAMAVAATVDDEMDLVEDADAIMEGLDKTVEMAENALGSEYGALTVEGAQVLALSQANLATLVGEDATIAINPDDFADKESGIRGTEGIVGDAWEAIVRLFKAVWDAIKRGYVAVLKFFSMTVMSFGRLKVQVKKLQDKVGDLTGTPGEVDSSTVTLIKNGTAVFGNTATSTWLADCGDFLDKASSHIANIDKPTTDFFIALQADLNKVTKPTGKSSNISSLDKKVWEEYSVPGTKSVNGSEGYIAFNSAMLALMRNAKSANAKNFKEPWFRNTFIRSGFSPSDSVKASKQTALTVAEMTAALSHAETVLANEKDYKDDMKAIEKTSKEVERFYKDAIKAAQTGSAGDSKNNVKLLNSAVKGTQSGMVSINKGILKNSIKDVKIIIDGSYRSIRSYGS